MVEGELEGWPFEGRGGGGRGPLPGEKEKSLGRTGRWRTVLRKSAFSGTSGFSLILSLPPLSPIHPIDTITIISAALPALSVCFVFGIFTIFIRPLFFFLSLSLEGFWEFAF